MFIQKTHILTTILFYTVMVVDLHAQTESQGHFVRLLARDAAISGNMRIEDRGLEKATMHGWYNTTDQMSWATDVKKGTYKVRLQYSQPHTGSAFSITVGNRQLSVLAQSTSSWSEYLPFDLGVVTVSEDGKIPITLQGVQLSLKGKRHEEALSDVHWLTLTPTMEKETFGAVDVLSQFKGKKIFDGKSFKGWRGNNGASSMELFRIEDGAIVGGTMEKAIPCNEFLCTDIEYGNFELRLKYKMKFPTGTDSWNAGIQIRSQSHPTIPHEMVGYQADILAGRWGALYDEQRRWMFLGTPLNEQEVKQMSKDDDWNTYIIRCEGARVRIWINGVQTLDFIEYDNEIPLKGYIALQIHEDKNPCEAWYKDIEIEEL